MASNMTRLDDGSVFVPEVLAEMVSALLPEAIRVSPFAVIDTTLVGQAGDTVTVPVWKYIGSADDTLEAQDIDMRGLSHEVETYTIKKISVGVSFSDEALLSGYGNPQAEGERQLALSIAEKIDNDVLDLIQTQAPVATIGMPISYEGVVMAIDEFEEEFTSSKALIIHPKQLTQLRLDPNFISADKYDNKVMMHGEVGQICNCRIVLSKKIPLVSGVYRSILIKLNQDQSTNEGAKELADFASTGGGAFRHAPAITIFMKRNVNVEYERIVKNRTHEISADHMGMASLTNPSMVLVCEFDV